MTRARSLAQRLHDDRGVVATAIVLFPVFAAVVFMFVQGAFWQLDVQASARRGRQGFGSGGDVRTLVR